MKKKIMYPRSYNLILLPLLPVIFFFAHYLAVFQEFILSIAVLLILLAYLAFAIICYLVILKFIDLTQGQASVSATILITFLLFWGALQDGLHSMNSVLGKSIVLLIIGIFFFLAFLFYLKRKPTALSRARRFLIWLFLLLIGYELARFGVTLSLKKTLKQTAARMTKQPGLRPTNTGEKHDIHYIVFDGYSNNIVFKRHWSFDNPIYQKLAEKGFFIVDSARSNYHFTPFSMTSIFCMQYLRGADKFSTRNALNFYIGLELYRKNYLFEWLKSLGYELSIYSFLERHNPLAELGELGPQTPMIWIRKKTIERIYLNPWIVYKVVRIFDKHKRMPTAVKKALIFAKNYNERALAHLQNVTKDRDKDTPIFTYTHFLIPHEPYIYDSAGHFRLKLKPTSTSMNDYLEQVKFANQLIDSISTFLLKKQKRKTVIIIQGDHGYRDYAIQTTDEEYQALSAYYFPDKNYKTLSESLSHVNTFRVVLNKYFNQQLSMLPDSIGTR